MSVYVFVRKRRPKSRFLFDSSLFCPGYQLYLRLCSLEVIRVVAGAIKVMCFFVCSSKEETEVPTDRVLFQKSKELPFQEALANVLSDFTSLN